MVKKFLMAGDKFMPKMYLKQPGFTYSVCGLFTENKEKIQKFIQARNTDYIYKNDLDKACFRHDMAYGKYSNLAKRTQPDKVCQGTKVLNFQVIHNMMGIREDYPQWYTSFLIKGQKVAVLNLCQINNLEMSFINHLLENKTIFGVLISLHAINKQIQQKN